MQQIEQARLLSEGSDDSDCLSQHASKGPQAKCNNFSFILGNSDCYIAEFDHSRQKHVIAEGSTGSSTGFPAMHRHLARVVMIQSTWCSCTLILFIITGLRKLGNNWHNPVEGWKPSSCCYKKHGIGKTMEGVNREL